MKPADTVYKMLAFQYKPLEAKIKRIVLNKPNGAQAWKQFQSLPAAKKIAILDKMAGYLNL